MVTNDSQHLSRFCEKSVFVVPFLSLTEESATVESLMLGGGHVLQHSTKKIL